MKKIFAAALFSTLFIFHLQAQIGDIKANIVEGADPCVFKVEFLPGDAVVLPNKDIQITVNVKATFKNIGNKPYLPGQSPLNLVIYQFQNGQFQVVKTSPVNIFQAGAETSMIYSTTYIKSKSKQPTFKMQVRSVNNGVPNPDVNMGNNEKVVITPI